MKRRLARFWYRFKNRFRVREGPGEPLHFLCGSEEELCRVTTWICHVRWQVFGNASEVLVRYLAQMERVAGHGVLQAVLDTSSGYYQSYQISNDEYAYSPQWCAYVFEHNTFVGTQWDGGYYYCTIETARWKWEPTIPGSLEEMPLDIYVRVYPPSAHERAEALLALSEWLNGKVSEQEKRDLLQLTDDAEI